MADRLALWLKPEGDIKKLLDSSIATLRSRFDSPIIIEPHVTLLGSLETDIEIAIEKARELASKMHAFDLELKGPVLGRDFFQYIHGVVQTKKELYGLFTQAQELFGVERPYYPHLSLLYGGGQEEMARHEAVKHGHLNGLKFSVRNIYLYQMNNTNTTNRELDSFDFTA